LRFGAERIALEELILRRAVGLEVESAEREKSAGGVMMIPIPCTGILKAVHGLEAAQAVPGIEEIDITIKPDNALAPVPEGNSYLGFIFARTSTPVEAEAALREAHRRLRFEVIPELPVW
jgi:hypothetical protein